MAVVVFNPLTIVFYQNAFAEVFSTTLAISHLTRTHNNTTTQQHNSITAKKINQLHSSNGHVMTMVRDKSGAGFVAVSIRHHILCKVSMMVG